MNGKQASDEDYRQLEHSLEQAQKRLKDVLSSLQLTEATAGLSNHVPLTTAKINYEQEEALDFESIFEQNGLLDVTKKGPPAPPIADAQPLLNRATYPLVPQRPDRPMTLSRPGQLPSCCNFKRQHWRLYVQGEFSYSSLPRYFKDAEREFNTSYKDDLESIISNLSVKDRILELEKFDQLAKSHKSPESECLSETASFLDTRQQLTTAKDSNEESGKFRQEDTAVHLANNGVCDSEKDFQSKRGSEKSSLDNDCKQVRNNSEKHAVADQNRYLMEDINKNCENIKSQIAILESVSEMIDRAQMKLSAESENKQNGKDVELDVNLLPPTAKDTVACLSQPSGSTKTSSTNQIIKNADRVQPFPTFETPPPPPSDLISRSDLSSSSFLSSSKKLKSRKSRNRSLQRCSEERLLASERRSRTLSPSITERLDYRVSRATQTSLGPGANIDPIPQSNMEIQSENGKMCTSNATEVENGKMKTTRPFDGFNSAKPLETNSGNGQEMSGQSCKKEFRKCTPALNTLSKKILSSSESHTKKSLDVSKFSTATSQNGKTLVKNTVSFAASTKSEVKEKRTNSGESAAEQKLTEATLSTEVADAETGVKCSETLLDKMHKKLYPYQYNKQNRTRSAEALSQSPKNSLNQQNGMLRPATLPQTKPTSLTGSTKPLNSPNANLDRSSQTKPLEAIIADEPTAKVSLIKTVVIEDSSFVDIASPSSGYSEMSPSSLKENAVSPSLSKRHRFPRALSPEQSTTSSSTPSPPDGKMSMAVKATGSSCHSREGQAAILKKNSKDIIQLQVSEKKLTDICEWLISAGFPQYVQLYREGNFPVALTTVESDHEFLDQHCLLILLQRITLLNKLTSMKIRLPLTSCTRNWYTGEMLFVVSPIWDYDPVYHWWQHSDKRFVTNRMKSKSILKGCVALEHSKNDEVLKETAEVEGCTSPPTEAPDEASIHLTSGYESETSPISTASLGQQKTLPQSNVCSSSQCAASLSNRTAAQEANAVRNCDGIAAAAEESGENGHGDFLGSSEETLKGSFCGSNPQSGPENGFLENIPRNRSRVVSSNCEDRNIGRKDLAEVDQLLLKSERTSSCSASISLARNESTGTHLSCDNSKAAGPMARGNRKSFYDNALLGNPQAELDLILKELYINIGSLDETLSNLDDSEDCNFEDGRLKLSDDTECSADAFPAQNEEDDSEPNRMDNGDVSVQETDFYQFSEGSQFSQAFPSKKAFLSIGDLVRLRKLCILKLTSIFEMHCPSCDMNVVSPLRFLSSEPVQTNWENVQKRIFGVPPVVLLSQMGVPLPPTITLAMEHLRCFACDSIGLFRKPGVQSRIQQLQNEMEADPAFHKFEAVDAYDLADVLKRYFREVPESLLTPQASQLLMTIFTGVPSELHLEAVQAVMLLLSDISRQVLHVLLRFLAAVADRSEENQMNASNLAVCFLPSFFRAHSSTSYVGDLKSNNQRFDTSDGSASPAWDHKVAVACITFLINNSSSIFQIPEFGWTMLQASIAVPETSSNLGTGTDFRSIDIPSFVQTALDTCQLKDSEWIPHVSRYEQTKLSWRLINDNKLLPMWRCTTEIEAPPGEVLSRLKGEQHLWDCCLIKGRIVERLNEKTDVFHYVLHIDSHEAPREFCELRTWKSDRDKGSYVLAKTSVVHSNAPRTETLRAITLASHYLIEPCGAGRSRVMHISRVDIRGHLLDWYHNVYGRLLERHLHKLNKAFTPVTVNAVGPETKL